MAGCWSWRALAGQLPQYPQSDPAPKLQFSITISFIWWAPGPTCSLGQTLSNESEFPPPIYAIKCAAFLKWPITSLKTCQADISCGWLLCICKYDPGWIRNKHEQASQSLVGQIQEERVSWLWLYTLSERVSGLNHLYRHRTVCLIEAFTCIITDHLWSSRSIPDPDHELLTLWTLWR